MEIKVGTRYYWFEADKRIGAYDEVVKIRGEICTAINVVTKNSYIFTKAQILEKILEHGLVPRSGWKVGYRGT